MSLENFLENLADPALSLSNSDFIELSDLSPAELGVFARHWFRLSPERKRAVLTTMVELAEESLELDFSTIFKLCLKDDDDWVLEKAIDGLWEYEDRSVLPGLLQVLASYRGPDVRAAAASALGKFCVLAQEGYLLSPDAANIHATLMAHLQDPDESLEVRRRSLEAVAPSTPPTSATSFAGPTAATTSSSSPALSSPWAAPATSVGSPSSSRNWTTANRPCATRPPTLAATWAKKTWFPTSSPAGR